MKILVFIKTLDDFSSFFHNSISIPIEPKSVILKTNDIKLHIHTKHINNNDEISFLSITNNGLINLSKLIIKDNTINLEWLGTISESLCPQDEDIILCNHWNIPEIRNELNEMGKSFNIRITGNNISDYDKTIYILNKHLEKSNIKRIRFAYLGSQYDETCSQNVAGLINLFTDQWQKVKNGIEKTNEKDYILNLYSAIQKFK